MNASQPTHPPNFAFYILVLLFLKTVYWQTNALQTHSYSSAISSLLEKLLSLLKDQPWNLMKSPYCLKLSTNKAQYCFSGERAVTTCQSNYHFAPFYTDTEPLLAWPINSENQGKKGNILNGMQIFQMFSETTHCNLCLKFNSIW